jgi:hypothetical protein
MMGSLNELLYVLESRWGILASIAMLERYLNLSVEVICDLDFAADSIRICHVHWAHVQLCVSSVADHL